MENTPDIRTREQRYRDTRWDRMFLERARIESRAFRDLKTPAAYQVLFRFLSKCQWRRVQSRPGTRDKAWVVVNNGHITYGYAEAKRHGIDAKKFTRAIDELVRVGFVDIEHSGFGLHRDSTLYSISDRWRKYGTDEFEYREREKRTQKIGFGPGNQYGQRRRRERNNSRS